MSISRIAYRVQISAAIFAAVFFAAGLMAVGLTAAAQHRTTRVVRVVTHTSVIPKTIWNEDEEVNRASKGDKLSLGQHSYYDKLPPQCGTGMNPWVIPAPAPEWTVATTIEVDI